MKLTRILSGFSLIILCPSFLSAQEHIVPLRANPALARYTEQAKRNHGFVWRIISDSIVITLPFLDDFSHGGPYPDTNLWMDNAVFVNNNYPVCPITIGVATLDGVNSEGQPYNPNCPVGASEPADSLTSWPINLTYNHRLNSYNLNQGDSLWFSFYWQAGGRGYAPLTNDTLILQFRTGKMPWTTVWYHLGYTPVAPDTSFHLVMIPVLNTMYDMLDSSITFNPFDPNFQFRFKNYACTSGNVDQWNIDIVDFDQNRAYTDTAQNTVSFVYESPSLLAKYQYMPWEQFTQNDLKDSMYVTERNDWNNPINTSYSYSINTTPVSTYSGGSSSVPTFPPYNTDPLQAYPPIKSNYNYSALSGPTDITITHVLKPSNIFVPSDDTLRFDQEFHDFYAYDDGSAEAAYFINGITPIYLAYQFTLNNADTLRGLDLYFNYLFVNPEAYAFRLALWDNSGINGTPGNLLFEDPTIYNPKFVDSLNNRDQPSLNGFVFYPYHFVHPDTALHGTFYVGWVQTYGDSLNIGWDYNTNHADKIFYNVGSGWLPSSYSGSMMMRPVFGTSNSHAQVTGSIANTINPYESLFVYPNPATNRVTLSSAMPANTILRIYTADGRQYMNNTDFSGNSIDTSTLPAGFYILEVTPSGSKTYYQKLLIQR